MDYIIDHLEKNAVVLSDLLKGIEADIIYWRPQPEKWCMLEIVCHLYDEECSDFRFRTQWVLERPNQIPPAFNPLNWVEEHAYMEQDYNSKVSDFLAERDKSISWLKELKNPKWTNSFNHSKLGNLTAGYFLTNWLAHDYLHMRQITKLKFDYLKRQSGEDLNYAGIW